MRNLTILFSLIFFLPFSLFATDWSTGRELEESGDTDSAVQFYDDWLEENAGDAEFFIVLTRLLLLQPDTRSIIIQAEKDWGLLPQQKSEIEKLTGNTLELNGMIEEAREWYLKSYETYPVFESISCLLSAAELSVRMGDFQEADKILLFLQNQPIADNLSQKVAVLMSRSSFQQGKIRDALYLIENLTFEKVNLEFLSWKAELFEKTGYTVKSRETIDEIIRLFPEAGKNMESGRWNFVEIPERMFGYFKETSMEPHTILPEPEPEPVENASDKDPDKKITVRIQTGSYRDPDNASEQINDLISAGFAAEIERILINGIYYNRVFVSGITEDNIENETLKLKDAGFEGFPVYSD